MHRPDNSIPPDALVAEPDGQAGPLQVASPAETADAAGVRSQTTEAARGDAAYRGGSGSTNLPGGSAAPERRRAAGRRRYDRAKYYAFIVATAVGVVLTLMAMRYLAVVLLPLAAILIFGYLVYPLARTIHRAIGVRVISVVMTAVMGAGLLAMIGWQGLPTLGHQTRSFVDDLHMVWVDIQTGVPRSIFAAQAARARGFSYEDGGLTVAAILTKSESGWPEFRAAWDEYLQNRDWPRTQGLTHLHGATAGTYTGRAFEHIAQFVNQRRWNPTINSAIEKVFINGTRALLVIVLGSFFIGFMLVTALYIIVWLSDSLREAQVWQAVLPLHYRQPIVAWALGFNAAMKQYLVRQAAASVLIAAVAAVGFTYVGLPLAIPLGMLVGLLGMIPYLYLVGLGPAVIIAAFHALESRTPFTPLVVGILATFAVLQLLHQLLLRPYIVGRAPRMERMALLLGAIFWPELLGYPGFFFAIPATCAMIALYRLRSSWRIRLAPAASAPPAAAPAMPEPEPVPA